MILAAAALFALLAPQAGPEDVSPSLHRAIEQALYRVAPVEPGRVELSNPAQSLAATFEAGELELVAGDLRLKLELQAWGRPGALTDVEPARLHLDSGDARRFEAERGGIREWYLNESRGLEQGFTIGERPEGDGPLWIVQKPEGDVQVRVDSGGRDAVFESTDGAGAIHYTGLRAWDARGRDLTARMLTMGGNLILEVEDALAEYPVQVDPWFAQIVASLARERTAFGLDVSVSGDTAAVGTAFFAPGGFRARIVHIFQRTAAGVWDEVRRLDALGDEFFGFRTSLDGDYLAIGAPSSDGQVSGYVSVRQRDQGGPDQWGEVAMIAPTIGNPDSDFGTILALEGSRLVIENFSQDAQVHERDAGGFNAWGLVAVLGITGQGAAQNYVNGVALSGDTLALANNRNVQIYDRDPSGTWQKVTTLKAAASMGCQIGPTCFFNDFWGVSLSGDTLMVANEYWPVAPHATAGGVFVFERNLGGPNAWGLAALLTASDPQEGARFGASVEHWGDYALVGAPRASVGSGEQAGVCYLFARDAGGSGAWGQIARIENPEPDEGGSFGLRVAASPDRLLIGGPDDDNEGGPNKGSAWVLELNSGVVAATTRITPGRDDPDAGFGYSVAISGETAVVGAWADSSVGSAHEGAAFIFERDLSGPDSWGLSKRLLASTPVVGGAFGDSVAIDGDRVVVGAARDNHPMVSGAGAAYVFERDVGGPENWGELVKLVASDPGSFDYFGDAVAIHGDTVAVGATQAGGNGAVYLFEPIPLFGVWFQVAKLTADAGVADQFGFAVALHGDTLLAGSPLDDDGGTDAGAAYVFERDLGGTNAWGRSGKLIAADAGSFDQFGYSVAIRDDLALVGSPQREASAFLFPDQGGAYTFERDLGGPGAWGPGIILSVSEAGARFGSSVALATDTVVVGAPGKDHATRADAGAVYLYTPSPSLAHAWSQQIELYAEDPGSAQQFGAAVDYDGGLGIAGGNDASISTTSMPNAALVFAASPSTATSYCTAGVSASGCQATLAGAGAASASAASGFTVSAANVEGNKDGLYFFGTGGRQANSWGNGTSLQCVVPPVARAGLLAGAGTSGACDGSFAQDLNQLWCPTCPKANQNPGVGAVVQLQLWYRDPLNTSNQTTSLSDALEFTMAP